MVGNDVVMATTMCLYDIIAEKCVFERHKCENKLQNLLKNKKKIVSPDNHSLIFIILLYIFIFFVGMVNMDH